MLKEVATKIEEELQILYLLMQELKESLQSCTDSEKMRLVEEMKNLGNKILTYERKLYFFKDGF